MLDREEFREMIIEEFHNQLPMGYSLEVKESIKGNDTKMTGINIMKESIVLLLSGATIPLAFFPDTIRTIVEFMPFRAVYDVPLSIMLVKGDATDLAGTLKLLGIQLIWAVVMSAASSLFWRYSVKKITVNGG